MANVQKSKKNVKFSVSNPEKHKLTRETIEKIEIEFNEKKQKTRHSFFADTKLQVEKIKRKIVTKINRSLFI